MGWAEIVVAGFVGVVATGYAIHVNGRSKEQLLYNLIPRFFLLHAFYEMQSRLPFLYKEEEWKRFYEKIKLILEHILLEVGDVSTVKKKGTQGLIKRVSKAIDRGLLNYLHSQRQLAELLHEYLPASGQSWAAFLLERERLENGSDLSFKPADTEEKRSLEALENMGMLMLSFLYDLKQIDESIRNATRGKTRISDPSVTEAPDTYEKIKVHYATDRRVTVDGEYTGERSKRDGLHYGHMVVSIPSRHKPGVKDFPQRNAEADPLEHIVILSINTELREDKKGFVRKLAEDFHPEAEGAKEPVFMANAVLLFIHGYNVHHKDAIKSAAQLKYDLGFKGLTVAYSWSSKGIKRAYLQDEQEIENTVGCLQEFITTILNEIPEKPDVHIVAHSMGNRALIQALHNILNHEPLPSTMRNVVFAAADESRERFDDMLRALQKNNQSVRDHRQHNRGEMQERCKKNYYTPQLTVYSSTGDWALFGSKLWHGLRNRLGDTKSFLKTEKPEKGSDMVDVSGREITKAWLHHSYYGKIPDVLQDIADLLLNNWDAKVRSLQPHPRIKDVTFADKDFFAFRPEEWDVYKVQCANIGQVF